MSEDVVYHYTSMDTLLKILKTKQLWASSINYLNDDQEYSYFLDLAEKRIPHVLGRPIRLDKGLGPLDRPFIASFTSKRDSLTHWRSYCPSGNGVCIGFRREALQNVSCKGLEDLEAWSGIYRFDKVKYLSENDTQFLDEQIGNAWSAAKSLLNTLSAFEDPPPNSMFYLWLKLQSCFVKHDSFADEREYRLAVNAIRRPSIVDFRATKSTIVPYLELDIPYIEIFEPRIPGPATAWKAVESLVIGPTPNYRLTRDALEMACLKHNVVTTIVPSNVTYRDW